MPVRGGDLSTPPRPQRHGRGYVVSFVVAMGRQGGNEMQQRVTQFERLSAAIGRNHETQGNARTEGKSIHGGQ